MHTPWIASPNWSTACNNVLHQIQRALHFDLLQLRMNNEVHNITIISIQLAAKQQQAEQSTTQRSAQQPEQIDLARDLSAAAQGAAGAPWA